MTVDFALYLILGGLAGILSGLFGIGGGIVVVPALAWLFRVRQFPPESVMVMAVATSLATIIITSLSATRAHHRRGAIAWPTVARLAPGILAGATLGSAIAHRLPVQWFKLIFALFLLDVARRMLARPEPSASAPAPPGTARLAGAGLGIGALSAMLGIGGGTLTVPFLVKFRSGIREAVAISAACGFPIALAGTAAYVALGWRAAELPAGCLGYVYLPACAGIVLTSIPAAPFGAHLAHLWPAARMRRLFAGVVTVVGGKLLWEAAQPWLALIIGD